MTPIEGFFPARMKDNVPLLVYASASLAFLPWVRWQVNPDHISYIGVASLYAAGHFSEAVNGYWAPLHCWLLAPLLAVGVEPLLAHKLLTIGYGWATLGGLRRILQSLGVSGGGWWLYLGALVALPMALSGHAADLLAVAILSFYLANALPDTTPAINPRLGILGAIGYLAKSYVFYFFLLHISTIVLLKIIIYGSKSKVIYKTCAKALLLFILVCAPWVGILTWKYKTPVISTSGAVNWAMVGPESRGYFPWKFVSDLPSPHALNTWQEPQPAKAESWSPWRNFAAFRQQLRLIWGNSKLLWRYVNRMCVLWSGVLLLFILYKDREGDAWTWAPWLFTLGLFPVGYLLMSLQDRYVWLLSFIFLALASFIQQALSNETEIRNMLKRALVVMLAISFVPGPSLDLQALRLARNDLKTTADEIRQELTVPGPAASCGRYNDSLALAYFLGWPYHGIVRETGEDFEATAALNPSFKKDRATFWPESEETIREAIARLRIRYVFVWPECISLPEAFWRPVEVVNSAGGLKIFRLSPEPVFPSQH